MTGKITHVSTLLYTMSFPFHPSPCTLVMKMVCLQFIQKPSWKKTLLFLSPATHIIVK